MATFAVIAGGIALILNSLVRNNWKTDLLTRLGSLSIACIVPGVIIMIYFGLFFGWQLQGMLLAGDLFFLLRGNGNVEVRRVFQLWP